MRHKRLWRSFFNVVTNQAAGGQLATVSFKEPIKYNEVTKEGPAVSFNIDKEEKIEPNFAPPTV